MFVCPVIRQKDKEKNEIKEYAYYITDRLFVAHDKEKSGNACRIILDFGTEKESEILIGKNSALQLFNAIHTCMPFAFEPEKQPDFEFPELGQLYDKLIRELR